MGNKNVKKARLGFSLLFILTLFSLSFFSGCVESGMRTAVRAIAFSPDGLTLLSCDDLDIIQLWDVDSGEEINRLYLRKMNIFTSGLEHIKWLENNQQFAISDGRIFRIFDINTLEEVWNTSVFSWASFSQCGSILANTQGIWDASTYSKLRDLNLSNTRNNVNIAPSGNELIFIPFDSSPKIIDIDSGEILHHLQDVNRSFRYVESGVYNIGWLPDESKIGLLCGFRDEQYRIFYYEWETTNYSLVTNKSFPFFNGFCYLSADFTKFMHFSANYKMTTISIIDIDNKEILHELQFSQSITVGQWSADSTMIAAGNEVGVIKIWDVGTGEIIQTFMTPKEFRL